MRKLSSPRDSSRVPHLTRDTLSQYFPLFPSDHTVVDGDLQQKTTKPSDQSPTQTRVGRVSLTTGTQWRYRVLIQLLGCLCSSQNQLFLREFDEYITFVLEIHKYSLWFSLTMAQYSLENVTQKATKTMVSFLNGRTNMIIKDNLFAKSKRNIILFCYFLSICI